jgi:hypothetical protein
MKEKKVPSSTDPYTGETFVPKRTNQKFASAQNRFDFHNERAREEREADADIYKQLRKNIKIVRKLIGNENKATVYKETLEALGFSFKHITGAESHEGKRVDTLFEFMIYPINNTQVTIYRYA